MAVPKPDRRRDGMFIGTGDYTVWNAKVSNPQRELEIICSTVSELLFYDQYLHHCDKGIPI